MDTRIVWLPLLCLILIGGASCHRDKRCDAFASKDEFVKVTVHFRPTAEDVWTVKTNIPYYFDNNHDRLLASANDITPKVQRLYIAPESICDFACVTEYDGVQGAEIYLKPHDTMPCKLLLGSSRSLAPTAVEGKTEAISIEVVTKKDDVTVSCCGTNTICTASDATETNQLQQLLFGKTIQEANTPYEKARKEETDIKLYIHDLTRSETSQKADCPAAAAGVDAPVVELPKQKPDIDEETPGNTPGDVIGNTPDEVDNSPDVSPDDHPHEKQRDGKEHPGDKVEDADGDKVPDADKGTDGEVDGEQDDPNIGVAQSDGYIPYYMYKAETYRWAQVTSCSDYDGMGCEHCLSLSGCTWSASGDGKCHMWKTMMGYLPSSAMSYLTSTKPVTEVSECAADTKYREENKSYMHTRNPWDDLEYIR